MVQEGWLEVKRPRLFEGQLKEARELSSDSGGDRQILHALKR